MRALRAFGLMVAATAGSLTIAMTSALAVAPSFDFTVHAGNATGVVPSHNYLIGGARELQITDSATGTTITCTTTHSKRGSVRPGQYNSADRFNGHYTFWVPLRLDNCLTNDGTSSRPRSDAFRFYTYVISQTPSPLVFRGFVYLGGNYMTIGPDCGFGMIGHQDFKFSDDTSIVSLARRSVTDPLTAAFARSCGDLIHNGDALTVSASVRIAPIDPADSPITITSP